MTLYINNKHNHIPSKKKKKKHNHNKYLSIFIIFIEFHIYTQNKSDKKNNIMLNFSVHYTTTRDQLQQIIKYFLTSALILLINRNEDSSSKHGITHFQKKKKKNMVLHYYLQVSYLANNHTCKAVTKYVGELFSQQVAKYV